mmetsp:Transcript_12837/g.40310  ORF Transcript_12837/g.40310 Transcript_12837/m.40310 type:complete len:342 (+) Transcript_12837:245-1270(+)
MLHPGGVHGDAAAQRLQLPAVLVQLRGLGPHGQEVLPQLCDLVVEHSVRLALHLLRDGIAQRVDLADGLLRRGHLGFVLHLLGEMLELAAEVLELPHLRPLRHVLAHGLEPPVQLLHGGHLGLLGRFLCELLELPGEVDHFDALGTRRHVLREGLDPLRDLVRGVGVHLPRQPVVQRLQLLGQLLGPQTRGLCGDLLTERVELPCLLLQLSVLGLRRHGDVRRVQLLRQVVHVHQRGLLLHRLRERPDLAVPELVEAHHLVPVHRDDAVHMLDLARDVLAQVVHLLPLLLQGNHGREVLVQSLEPVQPLADLCELGVQKHVQTLGQLARHCMRRRCAAARP